MLNWVDIIIIAVTTISLLFGLWRGLVKEIFSLLTWVAALFVARVYSEHLVPMLPGVLEGDTTRYVAAFAMLFIVTMMVGTILNHFMGKLLSSTALKSTDRMLGGMFGAARGMIIVLVAIFLSGTFVADTQPWQQSMLIPYGVTMIEWSKMFITDMSGIDLSAGPVL